MRAGVCSYDEDTNGNPVVEQTAIRALLPVAWAKRYLPVKGLEQLYKEVRPVWTREEPSWLSAAASISARASPSRVWLWSNPRERSPPRESSRVT